MNLLQFPITMRAILFGVSGLLSFMAATIFTFHPEHDLGMAIAWFVLGCTCFSLTIGKKS